MQIYFYCMAKIMTVISKKNDIAINETRYYRGNEDQVSN